MASPLQQSLDEHVAALRTCTVCPRMHRPPVSGGPVLSPVMLVGQAPGIREPVAGRPFAWTAGKTMFGWFLRATGVPEETFRERVYMAAVCRCFPGRNPTGGDRAPNREEVANCSIWLRRELELLKPALVIPVGKLAIAQFTECDKLTETIGRKFTASHAGHKFDLIPLPHPSGASPWHRMSPGKELLETALGKIAAHPGWKKAFR